MKERLLSIESSTPWGSVALSSGARVLGEIRFPLRSDGGRRLVPSIAELLDALDVCPRDLSGVAVSIGPGSFTGLRVGLSTARAIAFAGGLPLYTAGSLLLLARGAGREGEAVCALLDARREEVYAAIYRFDGPACRTVMEPAVLSPEDLLGRLPAGALLVGEGAVRYRAAFESARGRGCRIDEGAPAAPRASDLAALVHAGGGVERWEPDGGANPEPLYIRRPEAEVKWEERERRTPDG